MKRKLTCKRPDCGASWRPRPQRLENPTGRPLRCPRCGSAKWDQAKQDS